MPLLRSRRLRAGVAGGLAVATVALTGAVMLACALARWWVPLGGSDLSVDRLVVAFDARGRVRGAHVAAVTD